VRAAAGDGALSEAVARYLFKLMAYKDEYEVARLHASPAFAEEIGRRFRGGKLSFHLAPPLIAPMDPATGLPRKMRFGPWMMTAFRLLARLRGLRGTAFDIFGRSAERREERALPGHYRGLIEEVLKGYSRDREPLAAEIAALPERIRGYGHVKARHLREVRAREAELMAMWRKGARAAAPPLAAE
jgi:indolepyruvate ferredoxin oxidoreductase